MVTNKRTTPEWVEILNEDEIFVFGCRNSGRHLDGASAFALEHFGAVSGQREGRQGQSYAIPTIGGTIGLHDIGKSVERFTQYAVEHSELHFLVTPIGCGGGGWHPQEIAPLFAKASKLPNVSLPQDFWDQLNKSCREKCIERVKAHHTFFTDRAKCAIKELLYRSIGRLPAKILYRILAADSARNYLCYHEIDLKEGMSLICPIFSLLKPEEEYILNHNTKHAYMLRNHSGKFQIRTEDIDWSSAGRLSEGVLNRIRNKEAKYRSSGVCGEYRNGVADIMWQVSPNGKTYYLDKYGVGPRTDEKEIMLYGFIDTRCRFVVKLRVVDKSEYDNILNGMRAKAEKIVAKSI